MTTKNIKNPIKQLSKENQVSIIGRCFHSISKKTGKVEWQGMVIGNPEPGWYLLQLYEYFMGTPNLMKLVRIEDMATWLFYADNDEMVYSYEEGVARAGGPYRDRYEGEEC